MLEQLKAAGLEAAPGAAQEQPGDLDRRQRQRARPRERPGGDQAFRRACTRNLRPEDHVVVDLEGDIVEGTLKPSSDTASHLYIYRHRPDVNGIVHTHSPYATAFAAVGTADPSGAHRHRRRVRRADPVRRLCADRRRGDRQAGGRAYRRLAGGAAQEPRRLHGRQDRPRDAVKAAVMVEDVAKHGMARAAAGRARRDPGRGCGEAARPLYECVRAINRETIMIDLKQLEVWFVTGSQHLYGPETLEQVAEHSAAIAQALAGADAHSGRRRVQAGADDARAIRDAVPGGQRGGELRRPGRVDAHLLAGQDVDRRPGSAAESRSCTCTRSSIATSPGRRSTWTS